MIKKQFGISLIALTLFLAACGNKVEKQKGSLPATEQSSAATEESNTEKNTDSSTSKEGVISETEEGASAKDSLTPVSKAKMSLKYSNLVDQETRDRVSNALKNAGLKEEKIKAFLEAVDEYNNAVGKENLVQEMTQIDKAFPTLDTDKLVDAWLDKGGFVGRNCRITTYSLMGDFITIGNQTPGDTTMLFSDFNAISTKSIFTGEDKKKFDTLFSFIDVTNTHDTKVLAEEIQKSWKEKEVSFHNDKMHFISVFMTMDDGMNKVQEFVGHVGVVVQDGDKYLFIEKLAFELPYQVEEFSNLQELNDYLMGYYDQDAEGLTAKPLIFEDDHVLKEYRVVE